ncbi:hypothetical protein [Celerinatantimonas sp. MCCC 1A17872]|uniref:hypothetical protein n=1 Tax=Celerinatantimonas sp. MCCC 1A17872 TaxID=3177514 RepID=UPI0038BFEA48
MIKKPPYNVAFGRREDNIPAHVVSISETTIQLSGSPSYIKNSGYTDKTIHHAGIESEDTKQLMLKLNELGYAFAYDYKAYISPSYFMKQLLEEGKLRTSFKEISWKTSTQWCLTEYEFEK